MPGILAVVLVVAAISLTACGGSSSNGGATLGAASESSVGAVRYANCMRSNGVTSYPDPTSNGHPQSLTTIDPSSPTFLTAYAACRKYAPNGEGGPPAPTAAELHAALTFAQCVRRHGLPQFPDPLTTYGPGFTLSRGEYFPDVKVQSPEFIHAAKACGVQLPHFG